MPAQKGRDLLLKIGNGGTPETFATIGAARTVSMTLNNQPVDATTMDGGGIQSLQGDAGIQSMRLQIEGLFKDSAAEEALRTAAFARAQKNYQLYFANGDRYDAAFMIESYSRNGSFDGLEGFTAILLRSGAGSFVTGV